MNMFTLIAPFYDTVMKAVHKRQGALLLEALAPWWGKKVLDAGGGTGRLSAAMQQAGADVWLLDTSPQMINRAQRLLPKERCILGNAAAMPFAEQRFDIVTTVDAIHHIHDQEAMLREVWRVLVPGGTFAVLDFTPESRYIRALAKLERLAREPALFLTPDQLEQQLSDTGFIGMETRRLSRHEYLTTAKKPQTLK